MGPSRGVELASETDIARVRAAVRDVVDPDQPDLVDAAALIATELATNALLHGRAPARAQVVEVDGGVRVEVHDASPSAPLLAASPSDGMTGRGLAAVDRLAARWGADVTDDGKTVWAEVTTAPDGPRGRAPATRAAGAAVHPARPGADHVHVRLGPVPTDLLVAAKRHVDNLLREFALASVGERSGTTAPVPAPMAALVERVVHRFAEARREIKRQATEAAVAGAGHTTLELDLPVDLADAAEEYADALDALDEYSRANRLLTLETPPQHQVFRRWYIGEIVGRLRAADEGRPPPTATSFEQRLLLEVDVSERARRAADRAARLYAVLAALAGATTIEEIAAVVLREGVAALRASGGGVLLDTGTEVLRVAGTLGYDESTVRRLRDESPDAPLPAAHALRTGDPVWLEAVEERDARFPSLALIEPGTLSMCAVPVQTARVRGALRFSFGDRRLFDEEERRFALALATEASAALARVELAEAERESRRRLEHELLSVEKLAAVGEALLRGRDLPTVVALATEAAVQVADATWGTFVPFGLDGDDLEALAVAAGRPEPFTGPGAAEVLATAATGVTVRLDDLSGGAAGAGPRSVLAVPVARASAEVAGALVVGHVGAGRFGPDVERLVTGVAGLAAAAIDALPR